MRNFGSRVAGTPIRVKIPPSPKLQLNSSSVCVLKISTPLKADQFRTKNTLTA